jgi:hypothetical protein
MSYLPGHTERGGIHNRSALCLIYSVAEGLTNLSLEFGTGIILDGSG